MLLMAPEVPIILMLFYYIIFAPKIKLKPIWVCFKGI